jgi:Sulfotransferase family
MGAVRIRLQGDNEPRTFITKSGHRDRNGQHKLGVSMAAPACFADAEQQLHAAAYTGLSDFGADDYLAGLRVLLAAMDSEIHFNTLGREFGAGTIIGILAARLHTHAGWKNNPHCLQQPVRRPLVITGVPRTGTTALHKLLSMDPQFQGLEHWLTDTPKPRPPREQWPTDPHYMASQAGLDMFYQAVPEMRAAHFTTAYEVDECLEVLKQGFVSNRFASGWHVPSYAAWLQTQDEAPSYRYFANVLRLIGKNDARPWLLKNPGHTAQLDLLLDMFPDACVVQTHRDPVKALPSLCSVLAMSRRVLEGDAVNMSAIGRRECTYWSEAVEHALTIRQRAPQQFFDVDHRQFHAEPMRVVAALYAYFGLELIAPVAADMRNWLRANPGDQHGGHHYTPQQFNLDAVEIRELFKNYLLHFDL